jgi:hypothetical protein
MQIFKSYISFALILVMLFPIAEKVFHGFEHHAETHCTEQKKHFCQDEHFCSICDYLITKCLVFTCEIPALLNVVLPIKNINWVHNSHLKIVIYKLFTSLRAPPFAVGF